MLHLICDLTIAADNAILVKPVPKLAAVGLVPAILPGLSVKKRRGKSGSSAGIHCSAGAGNGFG